VERALRDDSTLYFAVRYRRRLIGQIMLHDMVEREAMVGYHIFAAERRGRGYGTGALWALCRFAFDQAGCDRLVIITSVDNVASRRIAEKCRFVEIGPAHEGQDRVVYERRSHF
jgi:RimJ/RimL family protein N-acetyltransferase